MENTLQSVLIDFGGVLAEEGFYRGLLELGKAQGLDPERFFSTVDALIYETGYLTGREDEASFWSIVRTRTGVSGTDAELREPILRRFTIRPEMIAAVDLLRSQGLVVAMLSDQTNWLDEINSSSKLFRHFDRVFNSYHIHKSKRDESVFGEVCAELGVKPEETLFIDDNINHIKRAQSRGLQTIHFVSVADFEERMRRIRR